jgi:large subunit ribosomal protein L29
VLDTNEIRELTLDEIDEEIRLAKEELFNLKFRSSYEQLENPALLRQVRRQIARLRTIRQEQETAAAGEQE